MTYNAYRQRGYIGNRIPGIIDNKAAQFFDLLPTDISGCQLWYDLSDEDYLFTDAGVTNVSSDGDAIYQVNDKTGNGNNATQTTSANRPLYKTNIQNGLGIARFDGSNDFLSPSYTYPGADMTFFIVTTPSGGSQDYILGSSGSGGKPAFITQYNSKSIQYYDGSFYDLYDSGSNMVLVESTLELNNDQNFYCNGALTDTKLIFASYSGYNIRSLGAAASGSANFASIDLAEVIIYDSSLSDTDRQAVETYLNNKWNLW